ncbi:hypothetical protein ABFX02_10G101400 [Erythranthe guttata]
MMAKTTSAALRLLCLLVCVVICMTDNEDNLSSTNFTWCVARDNVSTTLLQAYIKETCRRRTCDEIEPGGLCYVKPTCWNKKSRAMKHATYLLNWEYKKTLLCSKALGKIVYDSPARGRCSYP